MGPTARWNVTQQIRLMWRHHHHHYPSGYTLDKVWINGFWMRIDERVEFPSKYSYEILGHEEMEFCNILQFVPLYRFPVCLVTICPLWREASEVLSEFRLYSTQEFGSRAAFSESWKNLRKLFDMSFKCTVGNRPTKFSWVGRSTHVHTCAGPRSMSGDFLNSSPPYFLGEGLSLSWSWRIPLDWLVLSLGDPLSSASPGLGLEAYTATSRFLWGFWKIEPRCSCLFSKWFTN